MANNNLPVTPSTPPNNEFRSVEKLHSQFFTVRFFTYLLAVTGLFQCIIFFIKIWGWKNVIPENRLVERTQLGLLFCIFGGLLALAVRYPRTRGLYVLMSCFAGMAIIRECDYTNWYQDGFVGWKKWALALGLLGTVITIYRKVIIAQVRALLRRPSMIVFLLGFMLVVAWAQTLAQKELFSERVDRIVEETLEMAGYFLILMGVVEEYIAHWRGRT